MAKSNLASGAVLDGFTIQRRMHTGGMAYLYEVTHPEHTIPLLMKVPIIKSGEDPAAIVGFEMEQMIMPRLTGPHVPRFIASGDFANQPYLVFERIIGDTLEKRVDTLPLPADEVAALAAKIATALHDLHRQNVLHLDIKPANIILRAPQGTAVLIDYGLARHTQLPDLVGEEFRLPYGTAPYMAPEQVYGDRSDPRSDIFSLGALMYHFATGAHPFGNPQNLSGLKRRVWWDPQPPRKRVPAMPPWLQEIILRCLAVDPDVRHPTAAQLAFDLTHPEQISLTPRAEKLTRDPWTARLRRRFNPEAYRPNPTRKGVATSPLLAAPIIAAAIDLSEDHREVTQAIKDTTARILKTMPGARLACINVQRLGLIDIAGAVDADGNSEHVHRLVQLRDWARGLDLPPERVTCHVLEAVDAGNALLDYVTTNNVEHFVLGASTHSRLRTLLGSVATEIVQKSPCTVTVVRKSRSQSVG